jgi:hypothetical protein
VDIKDFLKDVKDKGFDSYFYAGTTRSYQLFETLVLKLLDKHLEKQGKPFYSYFSLGGRGVDGFAPEGFDGLPGPALIEIKLMRTSGVIVPFLRQSLDRVLAIAITHSVRSVVLIIGAKVSSKDKQRIAKITKEWPTNVALKILYSDDILVLLQDYAEYVSDLIPELTELAVKNVVKKGLEVTPDEWKANRNKYIDNLKAAYSVNELTLFLGAGVSIKAGVPDWKSLVSSLLVALIGEKLPNTLETADKEKQVLANYLQEIQGFSPLLETRYIRRGLGENFAQVVSKYLYENIGNEGSGTSETLEAIARLCIPRRSGPGVRALVTYNFDDLIEKHLNNNVKNRPIYKDGDVALQEELGIYHVHGFLPQDVSQYDGLPESLLVFSEEGYHSLILDPYSWSNMVQLNFLRESTCLLVGLSVTDPNLRRLLDIAARKNKGAKHYVFLERLTSSKFRDNTNTSTANIRTEVTQAFLSIHHQLQEASFNELGLNIIWLENYSEIPSILDSIK